MNARDIMTSDVATIDESSTIAEALETLSTLEIRHLPVVRRGGAICGMLSDRDLRAFGFRSFPDTEPTETRLARLSAPVSTVMSSDPLTVSPLTAVEDIVELMLTEKVGALPVLDPKSGELVGIVSYLDVLRGVQPFWA
ncbi:MAG: CBS domain-containing protein [Sandaracinaceae bacterium]|jgi:acetoin utilization protein AcuB|nr:CBS domain-containing protein [Sandaracinaceae bacterium]